MMIKRQARSLRIFSLFTGAAIAVSAAGVWLPPTAGAATAAAYATSQNGPMIGQRTPDFKEFLGIRYAQPPIGALRWQPPRPASSPTKKADAFGPHCPQNASPFGKPSTSEDCLFLNVFTPLDAAEGRSNLPVMVWIHGGNLTEGESDDYNPVRLVHEGVIVVTLNYRLGALGFLAQPSLDAETHPGVNYGLLDQQAALKWVQDNIGGFGGDPRNVTIFGQSAGGQSVLSNMVSPGARGQFARAINESGGYGLILPTLAEAEAQGTAFAAQAGCGDQSAACLRQLPVATILAHQGPGFNATILDGTVLPQSIDVALKNGSFDQVPILSGSNHDEGRLFVAEQFDLAGAPLSAAGYIAFVQSELSDAAGPVLAQYPLSAFPSPDLALAALETDGIFACNTMRADTLAARFVPAFEYEFSDENAPELFLLPASFRYGATHASELQFLFDSFTQAGNADETPTLTPAEQALAQSMVRYWTNFAKNGDPNGPGVPRWKQLGRHRMTVQTLGPRVASQVDFSTQHECEFWNPIISVHPLPL